MFHASKYQMDRITKVKNLFRYHYKPLVRFAFNLTKDKELAKDIVQAFFTDLWASNRIETIDNFEAFAFQSIKNRSISQMRDRRKFSSEQPILFVEPGEMDTLMPGQFVEYLLSVSIEQLPEKCREIFILSKYEGLTYEEIAETLQLSVKTVERQIGIGLKKLREQLAPYQETIMDYSTSFSHSSVV